MSALGCSETTVSNFVDVEVADYFAVGEAADELSKSPGGVEALGCFERFKAIREEKKDGEGGT